jgi:hypothetical protein
MRGLSTIKEYQLCPYIVNNNEEECNVAIVIANLREPTLTFAIQEAVFEVTSERGKATRERVMNRRQ